MKRNYIDFVESDLVPGALTGEFFHFKIEKTIEKRKNAMLVIESDEKYPEEKYLAVFSKNKNNGFWQKRISTPYHGNADAEMSVWLSSYEKWPCFRQY